MDMDFVKFMMGFVVVAMVFIAVIGGLVAIPVWFSACASARIYNQQNNTSYSCGDFFWAADQINSSTQTIKITK